jgi:hypothetical protein
MIFIHVFLQVFQTYILSVSFIFKRMFQMLHLDVSKVDRVLHMLQWDPHVAATCNSSWGVAEQAQMVEAWRGREWSPGAV